jgi:hypothetical protein
LHYTDRTRISQRFLGGKDDVMTHAIFSATRGRTIDGVRDRAIVDRRAACEPLLEFASRRGLAVLKPDPAAPRGGKLTTNGSARRTVRFARVRVFAVAVDVRSGGARGTMTRSRAEA